MLVSFNCDVQTVTFKHFTYLLFDFFQVRSRFIFKTIETIKTNLGLLRQAVSIYNEALKNSGFNETLKFLPAFLSRCHRRRNIVWFNPRFSSIVKTNVEKRFLPSYRNVSRGITSIISHLIKIT